MQGLIKRRRCEDDCQEHLLVLIGSTLEKYNFQLKMCPKHQRGDLPPQNLFPIYNPDGYHYTSGFVLGVDLKNLDKNRPQELMDFNKMIKDSLQKNNAVVFPKPNVKHTKCSVCKQQYNNYHHHIIMDSHLQKININPYTRHIQHLCSFFRPLWIGCQQKADGQAERQEQQRIELLNRKREPNGRQDQDQGIDELDQFVQYISDDQQEDDNQQSSYHEEQDLQRLKTYKRRKKVNYKQSSQSEDRQRGKRRGYYVSYIDNQLRKKRVVNQNKLSAAQYKVYQTYKDPKAKQIAQKMSQLVDQAYSAPGGKFWLQPYQKFQNKMLLFNNFLLAGKKKKQGKSKSKQPIAIQKNSENDPRKTQNRPQIDTVKKKQPSIKQLACQQDRYKFRQKTQKHQNQKINQRRPIPNFSAKFQKQRPNQQYPYSKFPMDPKNYRQNFVQYPYYNQRVPPFYPRGLQTSINPMPGPGRMTISSPNFYNTLNFPLPKTNAKQQQSKQKKSRQLPQSNRQFAQSRQKKHQQFSPRKYSDEQLNRQKLTDQKCQKINKK